MKNTFFPLLILGLVLISCTAPKSSITSPKESLSSIIQDYEKLGKKLREDFPSIWPNISDKKRKQEKLDLLKIQIRLDQVQASNLPQKEQINFDLLDLVLLCLYMKGVPGHHLQMMLTAEIENVPNFRKNTYLSAFGEGWGLYSEFLGKEAGMYLTPYEDFGRLTYEMWRACRLVVDPGMHFMGWTRQEAVDFMASNTALSMHEVNTEIDRYIGWPAQAVSYKIGELKIRELRKLAEKELGDKFDIAAFHDKILENGSVPLSTLERIIRQDIKIKQMETKEVRPN